MKRNTYSSKFKKQVALEALKERKTVNEIASHFGVLPRLVFKWKKALIDNSEVIFESKKPNQIKNLEQQESELHKIIGQLTVENDWLKKKL